MYLVDYLKSTLSTPILRSLNVQPSLQYQVMERVPATEQPSLPNYPADRLRISEKHPRAPKPHSRAQQQGLPPARDYRPDRILRGPPVPLQRQIWRDVATGIIRVLDDIWHRPARQPR